MYQQFIQLILAGADLTKLAQSLMRRVARPVLVLDADELAAVIQRASSFGNRMLSRY